MKSSEELGRSRLISRREAAEILGVNPKTVREYERRALLSPIRLNCRVIRYRRHELERLIAKASTAPSEQV